MISVVPVAFGLLVMYFILLAVLNRGPAHGVDWRHNTSVVSEDLDVRLESFLDQLDPVEMNGGQIDGVVMMNLRETKLNTLPLSGGAAGGFVMVGDNQYKSYGDTT